MTVVLALRCADGVVMASDSQITDSARGLSYPAQKLHTLGSHAAWGGSGSRAVLYDVEQIFNTEEVRAQVKRWVELESQALDQLFD